MASRYIITSLLAVAVSVVSVSAQDLTGEVTVQGQYVPTLRTHTRVSPQPTVPRLTLPNSPLNVEYKGVPTLINTSLAPMAATGWGDTKTWSRYKGYLEVGAGSYADIDISAGYRFIDTEKATLGVWLQHLSSSAYKPQSVEPDVKAHAAKRFDENIGFFGSTLIDGVGMADFDLNYHLGYFNYYSTLYPDIDGKPVPPTQTLNDFKVRVGLHSPTVSKGFNWSANLSDRYFGYRRFYGYRASSGNIPDHVSPDYRYSFSPGRENHLGLDGTAAYLFNNTTNVNLKLATGYVSYTKANPDRYANWEHNGYIYDPSLSGYGYLSLTPAFNYSKGTFAARLGVRLDVNSKTGKQDQSFITIQNNFGAFHAAPDIELSFRRGRFGIDFFATGGVELRTLAAMSELFYYQSPQLLSTLPIFSPINAGLTFNFGSFKGLSAKLGLAYKATNNILPDLLYPIMMDGFAMLSNLPELYTMDVKGFSLNAGVSYKYRDFLSIDGQLSYQPQNGETGYFNGADRPRWIIDLNAEVNPWKTLRIHAGYQYRGVRGAWYLGRDLIVGGVGPYPPEIGQMRLNDVTDLGIGASYTFSDRYTVKLDASNLLNNHSLLAPTMPSEGIRIMAGVGILF